MMKRANPSVFLIHGDSVIYRVPTKDGTDYEDVLFSTCQDPDEESVFDVEELSAFSPELAAGRSVLDLPRYYERVIEDAICSGEIDATHEWWEVVEIRRKLRPTTCPICGKPTSSKEDEGMSRISDNEPTYVDIALHTGCGACGSTWTERYKLYKLEDINDGQAEEARQLPDDREVHQD